MIVKAVRIENDCDRVQFKKKNFTKHNKSLEPVHMAELFFKPPTLPAGYSAAP